MNQEPKETITVGQLSVRFLVEAADSNGSATVFECYVPANSRMPAPHSHDGFEETIYGLAGVTTFTVDGETIEIAPGDAVCVQRGASHGFANHASTDATFLATQPDLVDEIITAFAERREVHVETVSTADESVFFPLPKALRDDAAA